jgi:hypothetical protein
VRIYHDKILSACALQERLEVYLQEHHSISALTNAFGSRDIHARMRLPVGLMFCREHVLEPMAHTEPIQRRLDERHVGGRCNRHWQPKRFDKLHMQCTRDVTLGNCRGGSTKCSSHSWAEHAAIVQNLQA